MLQGWTDAFQAAFTMSKLLKGGRMQIAEIRQVGDYSAKQGYRHQVRQRVMIEGSERYSKDECRHLVSDQG